MTGGSSGGGSAGGWNGAGAIAAGGGVGGVERAAADHDFGTGCGEVDVGGDNVPMDICSIALKRETVPSETPDEWL